MSTFNEVRAISDMTDTVETAVSKINTALADIASARNELSELADTFESLSDNSLYETITAGATALADEADALFVCGSIADATEIDA